MSESQNGLSPEQERALADVLAERFRADVPREMWAACAGDPHIVEELARMVAGFVSQEADRWA